MTEMYTLADATMKVIQDRHSIRDYSPEPVSNHDIDPILEAARQAFLALPSAVIVEQPSTPQRKPC